MDKISPALIEVQNTSCWEDSSPRSDPQHSLEIVDITSCRSSGAPGNAKSYTVQTSAGVGGYATSHLMPSAQPCASDEMGELEWADQREEMNCSSEAGSTPRAPSQDGDSELPCEPNHEIQPESSGPTGKVDIKDSRIHVILEGAELWRRFNAVGTEMIITKAGR